MSFANELPTWNTMRICRRFKGKEEAVLFRKKEPKNFCYFGSDDQVVTVSWAGALRLQ